MSDKKYFAADDAEATVNHLIQKGKDWFDTIVENNYIDKIKRSWNAYHGIYHSNNHNIEWGGEQGEIAQIAVNHYRNIASNILNMVTANRPAFQARATNTDYKSQVQVLLANGLLDYYMREKRLEKVIKKAVEHAVVLGSGFVKMEWDSTKGTIYDYIEPENVEDPETGEIGPAIDPDTGEPQESFPIYEGDVTFKTLSPFDVIFDSTKENYEENTWVLTRTFADKFDLAAKYPEVADKIKNLTTKNDYYRTSFSFKANDETTDVPVYEMFHEKTEALPNGRYIMYLSADLILEDTVMPYSKLPIFRIAPSDILGTPYGYTGMFDLLQIQESINALYSTILTNQNAFGVQNVLVPRNSDIRVNQLEGGMNFIEYNAQAGKPEPLNLTNTPAEIFNYLQMLEKSMEVISGVNSVARGNPESSLKSGTAMALVQAQALQFISNLQQSYIQLIEDVGTGLITMLKDFASVPRIAAITGVNNRSKMQEFMGSDLDTINRVIVDVGNALAQTTAGKVQMAEQLLQMGIIDSPEKYLEVMNTGKLTSMTQKGSDDLSLIQAENEALLSGEAEVLATYMDKHSLHIREHRAVMADPKLRLSNPDLIERTGAHIQHHIDLLRTTDPNVLAMFGEQPLGPAPGSPVSPENAAAPQPGQGEVGEAMQNPQAAGVGAGVNAPLQPGQNPNQSLPQPAEAPATDAAGNPTNPKDIPLTSG